METVSFQPITINASGVSSAFVYIEFHVFSSFSFSIVKQEKHLPLSFRASRTFRRVTLLITRDKFKRFSSSSSSFFEIGDTSLIFLFFIA